MSELTEDDIDFSRGEDDIVFVEADTSELEAMEDREAAREHLEEKGLEMENVQLVAVFRNEFSLHLEEDARLFLDGRKIWPSD